VRRRGPIKSRSSIPSEAIDGCTAAAFEADRRDSADPHSHRRPEHWPELS